MFHERWWDYECDIYGDFACHIRSITYSVSFFLSCVVVAVIPAIMHSKGPKKRGKEKKNDTESRSATECDPYTYFDRDPWFDFYHSLLWNAFGVLGVLCLFLYGSEIGQAIKWQTYASQTSENRLFLIWLMIYLGITLLVSFFFACKVDTDLLAPSHAIWNGILCCGLRVDVLICVFYRLCCKKREDVIDRFLDKTCNCSCTHKSAGALLLLVIDVFIGYVIFSIIPVVLFFVLHPVRVIALYTYIVSAVAFLILTFTEGDFERRIHKKRENFSEWKKKESELDQVDSPLSQIELEKLKKKWKKARQTQVCKAVFWLKEHYFVYISLFALFFLGIVTFVFVLIYHTIVTEGSSIPLRIVKALIPALLFGTPAVWLRRRFKHHYHLDDQEKKTLTSSITDKHVERESIL